MTTSKTLQSQDIQAAISEGMSNFSTAKAIGCCRVYVCINIVAPIDILMQGKRASRAWSKTFNQTVIPAIESACQDMGKIFHRNGHGVQNAIYIGYDNCTGKEIGQANAVAERLKAIGIPAITEVVGD